MRSLSTRAFAATLGRGYATWLRRLLPLRTALRLELGLCRLQMARLTAACKDLRLLEEADYLEAAVNEVVPVIEGLIRHADCDVTLVIGLHAFRTDLAALTRAITRGNINRRETTRLAHLLLRPHLWPHV